MDVVLYPDPILRKTAETVTTFDASLREIADAMHQTMAKAKGVGLAAPQVGLSIRLLVLNPTGKAADAVTLVNPKLTSLRGAEFDEEGCLSFPGIYAEISRATSLVVEAQDLDGKPIRIAAEDYVARIIQHEFDHLEGVLFVDRMSAADKVRVRGALKKLDAQFQERAGAPK
ncbi:MAG: peptide deformylase [Planctomycetes bacterium]|nr:peptide deformylase [Planctomycetota bacterium]